MSDHYVALVDPTASPAEAGSLAPRIVACLRRHELIRAELSSDCVLGGEGYPVGPKCAEAYAATAGESPFWELWTSGVEIHSTLWINIWGFDSFERAVCPRCDHVHEDGRADGDEIRKELVERVGPALEAGPDWRVPVVACRACNVSSSLHDWMWAPHPGFVNLAVVFWNWPPFDAPGWRFDVSALLSRDLGRPLVSTYGRI